jgi:hypothetical protein
MSERRKVVERLPTDPISPNVEFWCWDPVNWEDACEGSVRDARKVTRRKAAAFFASESTGYLPDVRVWKRYVRAWTRQDGWDYSGREHAVDDYQYDHDCEYEEADVKVPQAPPNDWQPDESVPVWEFVHRNHPAAIPVWICGVKGDRPPQNLKVPA